VTPLDDHALDRLKQVARTADLSHPRYQIGPLIASGGMGSVYQARDLLLDRDVAIKVLRGLDPSPGLADRLGQEARILARLDHPGLVPVHDAGALDDGRPFYVMRLVHGERLDHHVTRAAPGLAERLRIFLKVCEPVAFAHAQGVVHRDLKPANIMVGPYGGVLVLDWGIAKVRGAGAPSAESATGLVPGGPGATGPGSVLGTEGFMAPEQAAGDAEVDERADVWSLGAVLRELLRDLPGSPPRPVAGIRDRALAPRPADRYPDVAALTRDVGAYLDGAPVSAYRENPLERATRFAGRHRAAIGLIAAYLVMRLLLLALGKRPG
jgi:serine/threonine protein kinase